MAVAMVYNVWRGSHEPVTHTPGPLEVGRAELQAQLETAKKTELQAEQQNWNSPDQLRVLIQGHQERIEKLEGNKEAAAIVTYDRDSIGRLEKRIAQIAEQEAARAEAEKEAAKRAAEESATQTSKPHP